MTHWMCTNCGYVLSDAAPPNRCPSCSQPCQFNNVTCYRPECGFEQNIDPLLVAAALRIGGKPHAAPLSAPQPVGESVTRVDLFAGLSKEQEDRVLALAKREFYERGATITRQGDRSVKLYVVAEGEVAITRTIAFQKQMPICAVSSGEIFGWSSLVPPNLLTASGVTTKQATVLAIDAAALLKLFDQEPSLGLVVMKNVAQLIANRLKTVELEIAAYVYA